MALLFSHTIHEYISQIVGDSANAEFKISGLTKNVIIWILLFYHVSHVSAIAFNMGKKTKYLVI